MTRAVASCAGIVSGMAASSHRGRQPHARRAASPRLDQPADLGRAARVEVDVALADRRLLGQQAGLQQRLPHRPARARGRCRRSRARGGRTRCGSRPTCPCPSSRWRIRRATRRAGSGSSCGRAARAARAEQRRARASSCSSTRGRPGRPPSRATASAIRSGWPAPIGSRSSDVVEHAGRERERARAQAVDARRRARRRRAARARSRSRLDVGRVGEDEEAAGELARSQRAGRRGAGGAGLGELDERADDGGDEQPLALAGGSGSARSAAAAGRGREQAAPSLGGDRDLDRRRRSPSAAWRARRGRGAALRRAPRAGARRPTGARRPRRRRRARALERPSLSSTVPAHAESPVRRVSPTAACRASSSATRRAARPSGAAWPGGRATAPTARSRRCSRVRRTRSTRWWTFVRAGPGHAAGRRVDVRDEAARGPLGLRRSLRFRRVRRVRCGVRHGSRHATPPSPRPRPRSGG